MPLTPLTFKRTSAEDLPLYGFSTYYTQCRRFAIYKRYNDGWSIYDVHLQQHWFSWLSDTGLDTATFATRRDALGALTAALEADDLMDVP